MRIHISLIPATLLLVLLQAAPAPAASASGAGPARALSLEQGKIAAASLLERGEAVKAYELYMRLLRLDPDDDAVNLGLARSAARGKRWNQAVMAYETLLEKYPREAALYGELAHVYMLLGDREAAERSLAVMRSLDPASAREDTDKALDLLESRYSDLQFHGKIRAGLQYDSNANLGPASNEVRLGDFPWPVLLDDAKAKASLGAYLGADFDLGKRFYRDSPWWLVGDARLFWRGHAASSLGDSHSREAQWGRAAVGLRHLSSSTLAEVRLKYEVFDYEFYQRVAAYGPEGSLIWAASPALHLILKGAADERDYSRVSSHNGLYGWAGGYLRGFLGEDNHELIGGIRYLRGSADDRKYSHSGWEGSLGCLFKFSNGLDLAPSVSVVREYYEGPATILETEDREDDRFRAGLTLTYRLSESWAIESGYQYTRNSSNSALYKYEQHFVNAGLVWSF
ncbi:MAG: surface lipoprotein assembly modifier [Desulfovibrionaceae bacterium]|nr:surface lipoprotein assembly modifier [Desulfovibrionaceae bacterium]